MLTEVPVWRIAMHEVNPCHWKTQDLKRLDAFEMTGYRGSYALPHTTQERVDNRRTRPDTPFQTRDVNQRYSTLATDNWMYCSFSQQDRWHETQGKTEMRLDRRRQRVDWLIQNVFRQRKTKANGGSLRRRLCPPTRSKARQSNFKRHNENNKFSNYVAENNLNALFPRSWAYMVSLKFT